MITGCIFIKKNKWMLQAADYVSCDLFIQANNSEHDK